MYKEKTAKRRKARIIRRLIRKGVPLRNAKYVINTNCYFALRLKVLWGCMYNGYVILQSESQHYILRTHNA